MTSSADPPAPDEIEVSIFGPGIGECVVVHAGEGQWMVVDSCMQERAPIALSYLGELGVPATSIRRVIVTHWHDDHIRGVARVFEAASEAQIHCSAALNNKEFKKLMLINRTPHVDAGTSELDRIFTTLRARKGTARAQSIGPEWTQERQLVWRAPLSEVWALSPSSGTMTLAAAEIAQLIPTGGPKRNVVAQKANALAVVLRIDVGDMAILLSSDLETSPNPLTGWTAVVAAAKALGVKVACIAKVAHHGSSGADDPLAWSALLAPDVHAITTPFQSSRLPSDGDKARIKSRTPNTYFTAPSTGRKPVTRDLRGAMERTLVAPPREIGTGMGHVRLRMPARVKAPSEVRVKLFGKAVRG